MELFLSEKKSFFSTTPPSNIKVITMLKRVVHAYIKTSIRLVEDEKCHTVAAGFLAGSVAGTAYFCTLDKRTSPQNKMVHFAKEVVFATGLTVVGGTLGACTGRILIPLGFICLPLYVPMSALVLLSNHVKE
jgi:hypothetical protein